MPDATLQQQIHDDLTAAMKARDRRRMSALRMLVAALRNAAVAAGKGPQGTMSDQEVVTVVHAESKRRGEAAAAFRAGDREDQAASEDAEAEVYAAYLPTPLTDAELAEMVTQAIADTGATGMSDMGQVMKTVMAEVAGRADGSRVSREVKARLA